MPNILFIPEYGHVAYQIKENDTYNNTQENSLPLHTPSTPGMGSNGYFFSESTYNHVAYPINRNEALNTMQANILHFYTPSTPGLSQKSKLFFLSESGRDAYQVKGKKCRAAYIYKQIV